MISGKKLHEKLLHLIHKKADAPNGCICFLRNENSIF